MEKKKEMSFKDEGDFYTTKFYNGEPIEDGKLYPFGTLIQKTCASILECKMLASKLGYTAKFD